LGNIFRRNLHEQLHPRSLQARRSMVYQAVIKPHVNVG
jgi:hypothetical protein